MSLRPYQLEGVKMMTEKERRFNGAMLADEMGTGKTAQVATLIAENLEDAPRTLIICPPQVVHHWKNEIPKFCPGVQPENVLVWDSKKFRHSLTRAISETEQESGLTVNIVIGTYNAMSPPARRGNSNGDGLKPGPFHGSITWDRVVLDEGHCIKNASTQRSRNARELLRKYSILVTGTPLSQKIRDNVTLLQFVLGKEDVAETDVAEIMREVCIRREKTAVLTELPPLNTEIVKLPFIDDDERRYYYKVDRYIDRCRTDNLFKYNTLLTQTLLHSDIIANHNVAGRLPEDFPLPPENDESALRPSAKLEWIMKTMTEHPRDKFLIFFRFIPEIAYIRDFLTKSGVVDEEDCSVISGKQTSEERTNISTEFNAVDGKTRVVFIQAKAGGTGLNLQGADRVIVTSPSWDRLEEEQMFARAHRMGRMGPVFGYTLAVEGITKKDKKRETVDEWMLKQQTVKSDKIAALFDEDATDEERNHIWNDIKRKRDHSSDTDSNDDAAENAKRNRTSESSGNSSSN